MIPCFIMALLNCLSLTLENANSVTGRIGQKHVQQTVDKAAKVFGCAPSEVGVASTGIIGVPLPIDRLLTGLDTFTGSETKGDDCAQAILTTDLVEKSSSKMIQIQGKMFISKALRRDLV